MTTLLETINSRKDLTALSDRQLEQLAEEMRTFITHSVSQTGGHLASNLGVVETTIAMHRVFDFTTDRLLWDVGHQCYAHKILTGRRDDFCKLRQEDGLSGFPNPAESEHDVFSVGHAGTSISTAIGMARGDQLNGETDRKVVTLLNDNSMAIDVTQGAMAKFLSKVRLSHTYEDIRNTTNRILEHLPLVGKRMEEAVENFKRTLRMANTPSRLFESMNIPYFGPVDGHDINSLIELFAALSHLNTPAILHVYTRKGKGYDPADDNPCKYHSTGPFEVHGSSYTTPSKKRSFTAAFSDAITELGEKDDRVVAITAAMPDGTGFVKNSPIGTMMSASPKVWQWISPPGLPNRVCGRWSASIRPSCNAAWTRYSRKRLYKNCR